MAFPSQSGVARFGERMASAFMAVRPVVLLYKGLQIEAASGIAAFRPHVTAGEITELRTITFRVPRANLLEELPAGAILTVQGTPTERWRLAETKSGRNPADPEWVLECTADIAAQ